MIRLFQQVSMVFLCAMALTLIPLSTWGQSAPPTQQDQTNRTDVNQTNQNVDRTQDRNQYQNRSGQSNPGQTDVNRQRTPETPSARQNQQNTNTQQNTKRETQQRNRGSNRRNRATNPNTSASGSDVNQKNQGDNASRALPATAGELPLLALVGFASLIGSFAARTFAKSNR